MSSPEVVKWYTRARRFPQLIGRTPDGQRLPGGPYTVTQVVGAGVMLFAGTQTLGVWAHYGLLGNAAVLLGVTYAVVLALGRIPIGSRNPLAITSGAIRALSASTTGAMAGKPVRLPRPQRIRHRIVVLQPGTVPAPPAPSSPAVDGPAMTTPVSPPEEVATPVPETAPVNSAGRWRRPASTLRVPRRHRRSAHQPVPAAPAVAAPAPSSAGSRPSDVAGRPAPALAGVQALLAQAATASGPARPAAPAPASVPALSGSSPSAVGLLPRPTTARPEEDS